MKIEKVLSEEDPGTTQEDREKAADIFAIAAPVIPMVIDAIGKIEPEINGGFLVCFRANGSVAIVTGNSPPSVTIPVLKKVLVQMEEDYKFVETAFADNKGKAN